jgi:hypothetical protein
LLIILIVGLIASLATISSYKNRRNIKEAYDNYKLKNAHSFVKKPTRLLDTYPSSKKNDVSNNSYNDIWWHHPIFKLGSYTQITNNLKNFKNPDDGDCIRAEFCGALYKDSEIESNIIKPLPPVSSNPVDGVRVGYYKTPTNLLLSPQPGRNIELPAF